MQLYVNDVILYPLQQKENSITAWPYESISEVYKINSSTTFSLKLLCKIIY